MGKAIFLAKPYQVSTDHCSHSLLAPECNESRLTNSIKAVVIEPAAVPVVETVSDDQQAAHFKLSLRVTSEVGDRHAEKKVKKAIADQSLKKYQGIKPQKGDWDFELVIPFTDDKDLSRKVYELEWEMKLLGDLDDCVVGVELARVWGGAIEKRTVC